MPRVSTLDREDINHISEAQKKMKVGRRSKRTYHRCGKNKFVERAACPHQPALEGVARSGLLVLLGVITASKAAAHEKWARLRV
jgi:hypothetical protein